MSETRGLTRREFVAAAAAAVPLFARIAGGDEPASAAPLAARPFELRRVRLLAGPFLDAARRNRAFVAGLDPDRLLHMFRLTAGLPSSAEPLGGWEQPANELRGHFTGHYLSACALLGGGSGDEELSARGEALVLELAKCQQVRGNGYLSAFPEEFFDRLRDGRRVWAPFYTLHKIMAGLLDMHRLCGSALALEVVERMAEWTRRFVDPLGDAHMARLLEIEYGGMNELLYDLAALTGKSAYRDLAHRFDHERVFAPLAEGRDELAGLHANTTIPKILGAARRHELTGDPRARAIALYFWQQVTGRRSYCTGGTSGGERWGAPGKLAAELSGYTQECCCTHNMLKLTRRLFSWTADPRLADYYERALLNGILGTQNPADGTTLYYVPLASGYWKLFGQPLDSFWCCTGTGVESFAKLADSIYFQDEDSVYVNLFVASELDWREKQIRLVQETAFPERDESALVFHCPAPVRIALRVRVPSWTAGASARLNGRPLEGFAAPGGYLSLERTWRDGDRLELKLPMRLRVETLPDDGTLQAVLFGPLVLAGRLGTAGLVPGVLRAEPTAPRTVPEYKAEPVPAPAMRAASADPATWIQPVAGRPLEFKTAGQSRDVDLVPLCRLFDERYAVYWRVEPARA
jgi:DUF1680 family protein